MYDKSLIDNPVLPEAIRNCRILSDNKSRLGGSILHLISPEGDEYFMKVATGFEQIELIRENRNINKLSAIISTPEILYFENSLSVATLITKKIQGKPLHEYIGHFTTHQLKELLLDIFNKLWHVENYKNIELPVAITEEIADIRRLISENRLDIPGFLKLSGGTPPEVLLETVTSHIHDCQSDALSHGDFCLPNIIVTTSGQWTLIDWGKGGTGDPCRDLASLEGSLKRNGENFLFDQLLSDLKMDSNPMFRKRMEMYNCLDFFWYSLIL